MVAISETNSNTRVFSVPDIDWIHIPTGNFICDEDGKKSTQYLDTFEFALYPVTNCQYQVFIDDVGYQEKQWWEELAKSEIEEPEWQLFNRPRNNDNWREPTAFTRWLSTRSAQASACPPSSNGRKSRGSTLMC